MNQWMVGVIFIAISGFSFASDKYCAAKGKAYTLHFFGGSFLTSLHKQDFNRGVNAFGEKLKRGDELKVVFHKPDGDYRVMVDACIPGCPETGVLESFTAECSAQIAKKDRVELKNRFGATIKRAGSVEAEGYNVFKDLVTLSDYYRGRDGSGREIYVFHSLIPSGLGSNPTQTEYDSAFVNLVQNKKALPDSLPTLAFVNADTSKLNYEFWQDIQKLVKSGSMNFVSME